MLYFLVRFSVVFRNIHDERWYLLLRILKVYRIEKHSGYIQYTYRKHHILNNDLAPDGWTAYFADVGSSCDKNRKISITWQYGWLIHGNGFGFDAFGKCLRMMKNEQGKYSSHRMAYTLPNEQGCLTSRGGRFVEFACREDGRIYYHKMWLGQDNESTTYLLI